MTPSAPSLRTGNRSDPPAPTGIGFCGVARKQRKGQNEAWFRDLNEKLETRALVKAAVAEGFEIVCECDREECTERLTISVAEYERVRDVATQFIVAHGHTDSHVERVASHTDRYDVVIKLGEAAQIAREQNPRD
jgi:hypothetical protein